MIKHLKMVEIHAGDFGDGWMHMLEQCSRSPKVHRFECNHWRYIWHETIRVSAKSKEMFRVLDLHKDNFL